MADETREERDQRISDELADQYREQGEAFNKAAVDAREDEPDTAETEEEYYDRISNVPGIFGDLDTDATTVGAGAVVPSHNEEQAQVELADAQAEGDDVNEGKAKRQADAGATVPSGEEVQAGAEEKDDSKDGDDVVAKEEPSKAGGKANDKAAAKKS